MPVRWATFRLREVVGSLRFRLMLWNASMVFLMVVLSLWGVREGLRFSLWHEAEQQLIEDTEEVRLTVEQLYPDLELIQEELARKAISHQHRGLYIRYFDEQGRLLWSTPNAPAWLIGAIDRRWKTTPLQIDNIYMHQLPLRGAGRPPWIVRVGTALDPLEADIAQLTRLMVPLAIVMLIISPVGGYWLAGRATRPLAQIIDSTSRFRPQNLVERLPIRGTHDELDQLSLTINGFLDRLHAYLTQRREFIANAAHELRSPLAAIQSLLEVTLNSDRSGTEYKEVLAEVLEECSDLRVLINQLLVLAEGDAGHLTEMTATVELRSLVRRTVDMFQGVAESQSVRLELICPREVQVQGDAGRLRQVINNLVDNALKFTPPDGRVQVHLQKREENGTAVLQVADSGSGISESDLPHVFERFFQADKSRQRDQGHRGSGLGLSICRAIAEAHGGTIEISSTPGRGTCVIVTLPLAGAAARLVAHPLTAAPALLPE